jgi:SH3 domain protein
MLILSLREGPGNEHKVIKTLQTNTPLEVLEEEEGFLKVRTEGGEEGWVAQQYITSDIPKPTIIAGLNREIEELRVQVEKIEKARTLLKGRLNGDQKSHSLRVKELEQNVLKLTEETLSKARNIKKLTQKYDALVGQSKDVVGLVGERDGLRAKSEELAAANNNLKANIEQLQQDNDRLVRNEILQWFIAGSGVFFIGLIVGKASRKKKRY